MRTIAFLGAVFDLALTLFLLVVAGWVIDAWHDPVTPWAGPIVTFCWLLALVLTIGAPALAYWRYRKGAMASRMALLVWSPTILFVIICAVGLALTPL